MMICGRTSCKQRLCMTQCFLIATCGNLTGGRKRKSKRSDPGFSRTFVTIPVSSPARTGRRGWNQSILCINLRTFASRRSQQTRRKNWKRMRKPFQTHMRMSSRRLIKMRKIELDWTVWFIEFCFTFTWDFVQNLVQSWVGASLFPTLPTLNTSLKSPFNVWWRLCTTLIYSAWVKVQFSGWSCNSWQESVCVWWISFLKAQKTPIFSEPWVKKLWWPLITWSRKWSWTEMFVPWESRRA